MHVAIVGAGSLGCVYGVKLARGANVAVSFVVRPSHLGAHRDDRAMRIERASGDEAVDTLEAPVRVTDVPPDADVALVCVRGDQLDDALVALLSRGPHVPLVMLTPMMPQDYARLRASLGTRVIAAMPGVVSYAKSAGTTRYWLPRAATTLIDETRGAVDPVLTELVASLERAKIRARFAMGVHEDNPATTIAFMPLAMGLDVAGGLDALLADDALLALTFRAADESSELAARVGKVATWASLIMKFVGPYTLKVGVGLGRKASPEAMGYVEEHFGRKVHRQNVMMAKAIAEIAREKGARRDALEELARRLDSEA